MGLLDNNNFRMSVDELQNKLMNSMGKYEINENQLNEAQNVISQYQQQIVELENKICNKHIFLMSRH